MAFRHTTPEGREYISHRPQVSAREAMVASGHHYASQAGLRILEKGGNAIDAGIAAGICLSVLHSDMVSFLGVAPTIIYLAKGTPRPHHQRAGPLAQGGVHRVVREKLQW